jgi:hypothetical protein
VPRSGEGGSRRSVMRETGGDALQITIDYVKQESLGPLKATGRFVAAGLAATALLSVGTILLLVGVLRVLQTETGTFKGNLSWVPYAIVGALALAVMGFAAWRITKGPAARRYPEVSARVSKASPSQPPAAPPPAASPPPAPAPAPPAPQPAWVTQAGPPPGGTVQAPGPGPGDQGPGGPH